MCGYSGNPLILQSNSCAPALSLSHLVHSTPSSSSSSGSLLFFLTIHLSLKNTHGWARRPCQPQLTFYNTTEKIACGRNLVEQTKGDVAMRKYGAITCQQHYQPDLGSNNWILKGTWTIIISIGIQYHKEIVLKKKGVQFSLNEAVRKSVRRRNKCFCVFELGWPISCVLSV